jgi:hypothetical protein
MTMQLLVATAEGGTFVRRAECLNVPTFILSIIATTEGNGK